MKSLLRRKSLIIMLLLFLSFTTQAQIGNPDEGEDSENDPQDPPVPIDGYIVPMLLAGLATGYYLMRGKTK